MTDPNTANPTPNPEPAVSPTGAPVLPPKAAQVLTYVVIAALAGLGSAVALWPDSKGLQVALAVVTALAAVLGIASPGLRRMSVVLLTAGALTLSACSAFKADASRFFKLTAECSLGAATEEGAALIKDLDATTKMGAVDWKAKGEALGWDVLACALEALAQVIQNRLELALAPEQMGLMPDPKVDDLVEQLSRVNQGLRLAKDGTR